MRRRIMKGNQKIIDTMNSLLADELTAVDQYMVHANICANWGYDKLDKVIEKRAIDEMKHAEKLIARILFLEGTPTVSKLNDIHVGADVPKQFANDVQGEYDAVKHYNAVIKLCHELGDSTTREMLEDIEKEEEGHIDTLEAFLDQIKQMGLPQFLATVTED
jgi:bacterioferritin